MSLLNLYNKNISFAKRKICNNNIPANIYHKQTRLFDDNSNFRTPINGISFSVAFGLWPSWKKMNFQRTYQKFVSVKIPQSGN